ncbi:DUF1330 domain-containing protein [Amycolatopsis rhabdoformis]|uniref:DUF1330 domain-containing protein n=1 Tax=Amycolatopsis rhabdoformis TaxID=1448059 RepID=A0ABZ1I8X4_9PSEU|nr:DUF1330 domain-containing protein [Amycolatopsis rhabdoformis]WSE30637.1 DUF1330 domain-containing protein [Amycolatopsis rhabdoformis]
MTAYAIAHLRQPGVIHPEVGEYLRRIQSTLDPFGGRFLVHGAQAQVLEGVWPGPIVVVGFPDLDAARRWYDSPSYREILPLRTDHLVGDVVLIEGVGPEHDSAKLADDLFGEG